MQHEYARGDELVDRLRVVRPICMGTYYALYFMEENRYALVAHGGLVGLWWKNKLLPLEFIKIHFHPLDDDTYCYVTEPGYKLFTPVYGPYPDTLEEAESFVRRFRLLTRKYVGKVYPNLVYIEKYDVMLPLIDRDRKNQPLNLLVGEWLTDGLPIDAANLEKISMFCDWIPFEKLAQLVIDSGIRREEENGQEKSVEEKQVPASERYKEPFQLPGREKLSKVFNDQIIDFFRREEEYKKMGISTVSAFLLYGPPGSGKTYAVQKLASYLQLPVFEINSASVASPYIHDTSKKIAEVFKKAMEKAPSVLIIDEIEAYVGERKGGTESYRIEEVDEFLRNIPLAIEKRVVVFGMTNHLDLIDMAMLRKGRFDQIIEVGMPTAVEIAAVLKNQFARLPVAEDVDIEKLAQRLTGRPLSDVAFVVREAGRKAVRNNSSEITNAIIQGVVDDMTKDSENTDSHKIGFDV